MTPSIRTPLRRRRTLATAIVGALVTLPLLAGPLAIAERSPGDAVTFTGGCGLLGVGARSHPDVPSVIVSPGEGLRFVNKLGHPATLWLGGEAAGQVRDGRFAEVTFHDGPVTVTMQIKCLLGKPAGAVEVEVRPAPPAGDDGSSSSPSDPVGGDAGTTDPDSGTTDPDAGTPGPEAGTTGPEAGAPGPGAPASSPANGSGYGPAGGAGSQSTAPGGPAGSPTPGTPADSGTEALVAGSSAGPPTTGAPAGGPMSAPGGADELSARWGIGVNTSEPPVVGSRGATAQVSFAAQPTPGDNGSIGLLALVATVCLVGVAAGAIRTLVPQRANQAKTT